MALQTLSSPSLSQKQAASVNFPTLDLLISRSMLTNSISIGFIGGGFDFSPSSPQIPALSSQLSSARAQLGLENSQSTLPIGIGFITFGPGDPIPTVLPLLFAHRPAAVWLFAPASRAQHAALITVFKAAGASWGLKVFVQVGTVQAAREAVEDGCDVVVVQGSDAGGHQWAQGASLISLVPEVVDMLREEFGLKTVSVLAAGGITDGRGIAAGLVLGRSISMDFNSQRWLIHLKGQMAPLWAQGYSFRLVPLKSIPSAHLSSKFLVTTECPSTDFVKNTILSAMDGGVSTIKYPPSPSPFLLTCISQILQSLDLPSTTKYKAPDSGQPLSTAAPS